MTREEFNELTITRNATAQEYSIVEYVYSWHPSISDRDGKKQMAWLFDNLGMRVICDMCNTAEKAQRIDEHIRDHERQLADYREQLEKLKTAEDE